MTISTLAAHFAKKGPNTLFKAFNYPGQGCLYPRVLDSAEGRGDATMRENLASPGQDLVELLLSYTFKSNEASALQ